MHVVTTVLATIGADDAVDSFCPGATLYLRPPDADGPTFRGHAMPVASRAGPGRRIGVISPTQRQVQQALAGFGIVRFEVVVVGVAKTLVQTASTGQLATAPADTTDVLGRVVSLWYPTAVPHDYGFPAVGRPCAVVALTPPE